MLSNKFAVLSPSPPVPRRLSGLEERRPFNTTFIARSSRFIRHKSFATASAQDILIFTMQKQFNRRQFLRTATSATAIAPFVLSSSWAAPGQKGPNDRIIMGFIGTGKQGGGLLHNFLNHPDTQVLAVCDVDTTRREHFGKVVDDHYRAKGTESKSCAQFKDFRELLARKDIDVV